MESQVGNGNDDLCVQDEIQWFKNTTLRELSNCHIRDMLDYVVMISQHLSFNNSARHLNIHMQPQCTYARKQVICVMFKGKKRT